MRAAAWTTARCTQASIRDGSIVSQSDIRSDVSTGMALVKRTRGGCFDIASAERAFASYIGLWFRQTGPRTKRLSGFIED